MTYFCKDLNNKHYSIIPSIALPIVYQEYRSWKAIGILQKFWRDKDDNSITEEIPAILYLATWSLSNLIITDLIADKLGSYKDELKVSDNLYSDLAADSLDLVEIAIYLEKSTGIRIHEGLEFKNVSDLIDLVFSIMIKNVEKFNFVCPKTNLPINI